MATGIIVNYLTFVMVRYIVKKIKKSSQNYEALDSPNLEGFGFLLGKWWDYSFSVFYGNSFSEGMLKTKKGLKKAYRYFTNNLELKGPALYVYKWIEIVYKSFLKIEKNWV